MSSTLAAYRPPHDRAAELDLDVALRELPAMVQLADWRRRVSELYAEVRATRDPETAWRLWRKGRDALFAKHPQSPVDPEGRAGFAGVDCYDYDPALRFLAGLESMDSPVESWDIGADGVLRPRPVARTVGLTDALGGELTLYWITGYGGGLFLPFSDATSGRETYGGGRYLIDAIKGADLGLQDGRLVLDFNFAYYPSCAHNAAWTCPLAPPENRLDAPVRGGERG